MWLAFVIAGQWWAENVKNKSDDSAVYSSSYDRSKKIMNICEFLLQWVEKFWGFLSVTGSQVQKTEKWFSALGCLGLFMATVSKQRFM